MLASCLITTDCQTCYLIYISNPSHTPKSRKTELKSNKQLVYEFQREIDRQNDETAREAEGEKMVEIHELSSHTSPGKLPSKAKVVTPTAAMKRESSWHLPSPARRIPQA